MGGRKYDIIQGLTSSNLKLSLWEFDYILICLDVLKILLEIDSILEILNSCFSSKTMATAAVRELWKKKKQLARMILVLVVVHNIYIRRVVKILKSLKPNYDVRYIWTEYYKVGSIISQYSALPWQTRLINSHM